MVFATENIVEHEYVSAAHRQFCDCPLERNAVNRACQDHIVRTELPCRIELFVSAGALKRK